MGLLVDVPKSGGSRANNDENIAHRFFLNGEVSATITGVDQDIIHRFSVILQTLLSVYDTEGQAFDEYRLQTAKLYVEKYS